MKAMLAVLRDRRRSQRGSVLSAVLIMVAMLAILAGALLTQLSTNFLLATRLVDRVNNEATINSAMELAISQLQDQTTPLFSGCPTLSAPPPMNGSNAVPAYASCYPAIDMASSQQLSGIVSGGQFVQDGTHAVVTGAGVDAYVTGDASGNLFAIPTGSTSARWSSPLGGQIVGTPLVMADAGALPDGVAYLVPVNNPSNGQNLGCSTNCVALLAGNHLSRPSLSCLMAARGPVTSQPAAGQAFNNLAYFGDASGNIYAASALASQSGNQSGNGQCDLEDSVSVPSNIRGAGAILAGPFVVKNRNRRATDEVYAIVANGSSSNLVHYSLTTSGQQQPDFSYAGSIALPGIPAGAALQNSSLAIGFTNGLVALVQIQSTYAMSLVASRQLGAPIGDTPLWAGSQIGVGAGSTLYVLDGALNVVSTFAAPTSITTTPAADAGGDWFVAAGGSLYVAPKYAGSAQMPRVAATAGAGNLTSAPMAFACTTGICIYSASSDGNVYFAGLDARDATLDSCLVSCASSSFNLRATIEVGAASSPQTVHVQGWSYYSP